MECDVFKRLISRELDGEIGEKDRELLGEHIVSCSGCRRFRESLVETISLHQGLPEAEPPPTILPVVIAAAGKPEPVSLRKWMRRLAIPAAAVLVMLLGVGAGGYLSRAIAPAGDDNEAEVLELEYLGEYPPGSVGEVLLSEAEGGGDEQR